MLGEIKNEEKVWNDFSRTEYEDCIKRLRFRET